MNKHYDQNVGNGFPEMPNGLREILIKASKQAGIERIALVGGAVRDLLLGLSTKSHRIHKSDLDFVVEGSAKELVASLEQQSASFVISDLQIHGAYDSVKLKINGFNIDITSSRSETYPAPGENPSIEICCLETDLYRRDFTINAIAIDLSKKEIIEVNQAREDLASKRLNFLHKKSVEEDPTRVIRGARYAARLGFSLSDDSLQQIQSTIKDWPWAWKLNDLPKDAPPGLSSRLGMELKLMFDQEPWEDALKKLQKWGALKLLDAPLHSDQFLFEL